MTGPTPRLDPLYSLLRHLTLPVVAVTASADGRRNGLIVNSAQRASLVPSRPRVSLYISKTNHTHDLVYRSGLLGLHLLRDDQWEIIWKLGFASGRDVDKLEGVELVVADQTRVPLLADARAGFGCRVVNAMDAGAATFFLADVVDVREGAEAPIMTSDWFRTHMPDDRAALYLERLEAAQSELERLAAVVERKVWPGPVTGP